MVLSGMKLGVNKLISMYGRELPDAGTGSEAATLQSRYKHTFGADSRPGGKVTLGQTPVAHAASRKPRLDPAFNRAPEGYLPESERSLPCSPSIASN